MSNILLPPYEAPYKPVPQVTPFTYRDGVTMLKKLELLQRYINKDLVPFVNDKTEELGDAFETQANALIEAVNAAIELVLEGSVEAQDPIIAALIADAESLTFAALVTWGNARYVEPSDFNGLGDPRYPVYRLWDGDSYPARVAGATNLFLGPDDPGVAMDDASDFWLNPNFLTVGTGDARYPVYRVWTGTEYPARIAGALNIFFGPTDPGLAMDDDDYWANPNYTTVAEVTSEINTPGSSIANAVALAASANPFIMFGADALEQAGGGTLVRSSQGASPSQHMAWELTNTLVSRVYASFIVPNGWTGCKIRYFWYHQQSGGTGNVVFTTSVTPVGEGTAIAGVTGNASSNALAANVVKETLDDDVYPLTPGRLALIMCARNGPNASDTLEYTIYLLGIRIEKA